MRIARLVALCAVVAALVAPIGGPTNVVAGAACAAHIPRRSTYALQSVIDPLTGVIGVLSTATPSGDEGTYGLDLISTRRGCVLMREVRIGANPVLAVNTGAHRFIVIAERDDGGAIEDEIDTRTGSVRSTPIPALDGLVAEQTATDHDTGAVLVVAADDDGDPAALYVVKGGVARRLRGNRYPLSAAPHIGLGDGGDGWAVDVSRAGRETLGPDDSPAPTGSATHLVAPLSLDGTQVGVGGFSTYATTTTVGSTVLPIQEQTDTYRLHVPDRRPVFMDEPAGVTLVATLPGRAAFVMPPLGSRAGAIDLWNTQTHRRVVHQQPVQDATPGSWYLAAVPWREEFLVAWDDGATSSVAVVGDRGMRLVARIDGVWPRIVVDPVVGAAYVVTDTRTATNAFWSSTSYTVTRIALWG